jgi:hypothetical protein
MPIISSIIAFFKGISKRKKAAQQAEEEDDDESENQEEKNIDIEVRSAADKIIRSIIPQGHTIDTYMEELSDRWSRLLNKKARENLIDDVQSLLRDQIRRNLKIHKHFKLTRENISQIAANCINRSQALSSLSGKDSLILYSELYMLKFLKSFKK